MGGVQSIGEAGFVSRAGGPAVTSCWQQWEKPTVPDARVPGSRDLTGMYTCLEVLVLRALCERRRSLRMASTAQAGLRGGTLSLTFRTRTGSCGWLRS